MIRCDSLAELVNLTLRQGDDLNCWVYTDFDAWKRQPTTSVFYFLDEREVESLPDEAIYQTEEGGWLPLDLKPFDLEPWLESGTLVGVIENAAVPADPSLEEIERFIHASNFYLERDAFYSYLDPAA